MADIAPLWPLRYDAGLLKEVVAPPYDVIDPKLRKELGERHPHNVVHIDLPEGDGDKKYERAQGLFTEWQEMGVVVRDEAPAYWRYAQTFLGPVSGAPMTRKGFLALVRAVPFSERVVLPHERTLQGKKVDRMQLSRATRAALSPQFMLYSDPERRLDALLDSGEAFADFRTSDGIRHQIWRVTAPTAVASITAAMASRTLLIADGHHRYETAAAISEEFEAEANERGLITSSRSEHRFTFALLANGDDPNLVVLPTHRLVHSLSKFAWNELITQARVLFDVTPMTGSADALVARLAKETRPAICALVKGGTAALLVLRNDADLAGHPVLGLRPAVLRNSAVVLLHHGLLEYVLGITPEEQADKTNLAYLQEPSVGEALLESGEGQVLFLLNGTSVSTVRRVAEAGEVMPENSTYFYPKVPTGLCFHTLYPDRLIA
jgi:uncharacterized protein (DUF1015 family)